MSLAPFSRRAALLGAATLAAVPAMPVMAAAVVPEVDLRLAALAAEICSTLDGAAYAFDPIIDKEDQRRRIVHANALTLDFVALPAAGLAGVLEKAKAYLDSASYDVLYLSELSTSLAEDVERVLEQHNSA